MTLQVAPPDVTTSQDEAVVDRQSGWVLVAEQETRDLWTSGRGLILLFLFSILLSGVTYLTSTNQALNFLEQRESVNLVLQLAVAVGVLVTLVVSADGISGERERGTLESLLVTPVSRRSIIAGKLIAALTMWFATFGITIPYVWVLARDVGILGQALALGFLVGTLVAIGLGSVGLLISGLCNSNKTSIVGQHLLVVDLVRTDPTAQRSAAGRVLRRAAARQPGGLGLGLHLLGTRRRPELDGGPGLTDHAAPHRDHRRRRTRTRRRTAGQADPRGECRMRALIMIVLLAGVLTGVPAPALADPLNVRVAADPPVVSTVLGGHFTVTTEVKNAGNAPTGEILAHLNVASIEGSVYVDPEDWSSDRSQQLSLKPGESRKLSWEIQAVNAGLFAAYVVVVPFGNTVNGNEDLTTSPLIRVDVAQRTTLTAGGALPVVLAVPLLIGLAAATVLVRVRRRRA